MQQNVVWLGAAADLSEAVDAFGRTDESDPDRLSVIDEGSEEADYLTYYDDQTWNESEQQQEAFLSCHASQPFDD